MNMNRMCCKFDYWWLLLSFPVCFDSDSEVSELSFSEEEEKEIKTYLNHLFLCLRFEIK